SLLARGDDAAAAAPEVAAAPEPWLTLSGLPTLGAAGDAFLLARRRAASRKPRPPDPVVIAVGELRSGDPLRVRQALASTIAPELAPHLIPLVGRDDVARDAITALHAIAPRCTGVLVD